MPIKNFKKDFFLFLVLLLLQLSFLYFVKYLNQHLTFNNFSILKTGNFFNLILYVGIIVGLYLIIKMKQGSMNRRVIIILLVVSWLFLIIAFISTRMKIIAESVFILSQPGDKILTGLLFLLFLITLLYLFTYIWSVVISKQEPRILKIFFRTSLLMIVFYFVIIIYADNVAYTSGRWSIKKNKNNVAVVLGAAVWSGNIPSPTLSSRVDKALELSDKGFVGKIVLTGGKAPGELSESEVAYDYALARGAEKSLIIIESFTSSTNDQIKWIKNNLSEDDSVADIILVSDAYHLPRTIEISKFFNLNIKVAESVHELNFKDLLYYKIRESIALFNFWNFAL